MIFSEAILIADGEPHGGALNMALDEILLHSSGAPVLRCYRWLRPCVSFGYFGAFEEVSRRWPNWEHVRRWTGGGMVEHGTDFTYTLAVPRDHELTRLNAAESYRIIHGAVAVALRRSAGAAVALSGEGVAAKSNACFENPVRNDVLVDGRKVAGGAQRRMAQGLLHQGSIQLPPGSGEFGAALGEALAEKVVLGQFTAEEMAEAEKIAKEKYGSEEWMRRY